jgi:hypothetical protein
MVRQRNHCPKTPELMNVASPPGREVQARLGQRDVNHGSVQRVPVGVEHAIEQRLDGGLHEDFLAVVLVDQNVFDVFRHGGRAGADHLQQEAVQEPAGNVRPGRGHRAQRGRVERGKFSFDGHR